MAASWIISVISSGTEGELNPPIILTIHDGNKRYNEISNSIPAITNRVLSKELKLLEENLLIKRTVIDDFPMRIEYTITDYCFGIEEVVKPMEKWGKSHQRKIRELD
ncbi:winged helix-turn-helix transcriptional regulator [Echinicola rosea]|uniref:HTH hxlR-type domain-containing protein n=1 Tax=Echinicola rosea TaxID=1807691 RepID=A0ABQ1URT3_9BACT|nr:winged helix-turn-helix transcriptional regulator [Echinicola rosea]GGF25006.1 hypothetical protein GCM10011339_11390 [Echinicola rosea]